MATILLVDDDDDLLALCRHVLEVAGHKVTTAADGEYALQVLQDADFDLIVTDVMMPRLDGWNLVRTIRAYHKTAFTPVIFFSALAGKEDRLKGFALGADDYLPKPFDPQELVSRVERMFGAKYVETDTRRSLTGGDMAGHLDKMGLSAILMLLEMERATAAIVFERDDEDATLYVRDGMFVGGEYGDRTGPDALFGVIEWSSGRYTVHLGRSPKVADEPTPLSHLLLEAARLADEAAAGKP